MLKTLTSALCADNRKTGSAALASSLRAAARIATRTLQSQVVITRDCQSIKAWLALGLQASALRSAAATASLVAHDHVIGSSTKRPAHCGNILCPVIIARDCTCRTAWHALGLPQLTVVFVAFLVLIYSARGVSTAQH
jgi:hypothetical protein